MRRLLLALGAVLAAFAHAIIATPHTNKMDSNVQQAVQLSLLHMFGFKNRPRSRSDTPSSSTTHVPPTMLQLYKRQRRLVGSGVHFVRRESSNANTVRSFSHTESPDDDSEDPHRFLYRFNITGMPLSEDPRAAELRLYRQALHSPEQTKHRIHVYDVVRPETRHSDALLRLIDTREVDVRQSRWETFDVFPAISRWRRELQQNHGLVVQVTSAQNNAAKGEHVRLRRSVDQNANSWLTTQPVLLVFSDDGRRSGGGSLRSRRNAEHHNPRRRRKGHRDNCRRHALYVDFSDVGWNDWIVAPPGYQAYYCHGDCPFPLAEHLNATNHAIVQTLVHSVKPKAVPRACCVPTELTPISMLYLDENDKVVLKNYQDMVVEGCGCR